MVGAFSIEIFKKHDFHILILVVLYCHYISSCLITFSLSSAFCAYLLFSFNWAYILYVIFESLKILFYSLKVTYVTSNPNTDFEY